MNSNGLLIMAGMLAAVLTGNGRYTKPMLQVQKKWILWIAFCQLLLQTSEPSNVYLRIEQSRVGPLSSESGMQATAREVWFTFHDRSFCAPHAKPPARQ